ncbi:hypothetical protein ARAM_003714 [Aspergillus rambellii]|uniref:Fe2OG dioxygenase domain-containing protein n=1 Tax=Aspergillus rambellii TaxID=308745 RepID=A0A0F8V1P3_9EURO|nr:hypothetical protein ARAM_003714 [Aspergillus rambellii]
MTTSSTIKTHFGEITLQEEIVSGDFDIIPIIDLTALDSPGSCRKEGACSRNLHGMLRNHGIPAQDIEAVQAAARQFFGLPEEGKLECFLGKSNVRTLRAFTTLFFYIFLSSDSASTATARYIYGEQKNLSESFDIGYEIAGDPQKRPGDILPEDSFELYGGNLWPSETALPGFKDTYLHHFRSCIQLSRRLLKVFALAFDLPETFFDPLPPQADYECFAILAQDSVPALQVLNSRNQWVTATPIPGTLVVNIGDFMSLWTGGKFRSTVHRATNLTGENRYSIPFFFGVNYDATIQALPSCEGGELAKRGPIKAGQYVRDRLSKSYIGFGEKPKSVG